MRRRTGSVGVTVVSSMALSSVWAAQQAVWSPDKALAGQLAAPTVAGAYQIQPPKGYVMQTGTPPGGTAQAWVGAPRADGTRPYIMLAVMIPPADEKIVHTLDQVFAGVLAGVQKRRKDWKQTPSATGTVNGLTFVRTYWQGTDTATGLAMRGFSYAAQDGKRFVLLSSQDMEPYTKTALLLAEASALTFRKR